MDDAETSTDDVGVQSSHAAERDGTPSADPYSLGSLTFADLPRQPGDGAFSSVMRQLAAKGHSDLQEWAAKDLAERAKAAARDDAACRTRRMLVTAYDVHGPGKDWAYWRSRPEGVGPGTVAVANSTPQPYPFGTTFKVRNSDGSTAYAGAALDTGAGWDSQHHDVDPKQWIDIWLADDRVAKIWGAQWRDVEICDPAKREGK